MEIADKAGDVLERNTEKEEGSKYKVYARKEFTRIAIFPTCCKVQRANDGLSAPLRHKSPVKLKH